MPTAWTSDSVLQMARGYQPGCVLMAAAELDLFTVLAKGPMTAGRLATAVDADQRATTFLADALAALELLVKDGESYSLAPGARETLTEGGSACVLPMLQHQANCLRSWAQLAAVVKSGHRHDRPPSIRGEAGDLASFIEAMEVGARTAAPKLVASLGALQFTHLLDIGGGPGTWTIAFLRAHPSARATLYDLPDVIPIAKKHVEAAGLSDRVDFAPGSFEEDPKLPSGADLAWVSAIVHMNSRQQNRDLFAKVHAALVPGGRILVRDVVMDDDHVTPAGGALFAINMLVNTERGGTFSFAELCEDLERSGFAEATLTRGERDMDSVVRARRA
ncbi:MAG: methyltransferase domain-containing protein [Candidatus Latescibacteria bacterium]|nr:methyltransferase domain-containing protein [Candidatus Latescibacterota bacterium]